MTTRLERIRQLAEIRHAAMEGYRSPLARNFQGLYELDLDMIATIAERRLRVLWFAEHDKGDFL